MLDRYLSRALGLQSKRLTPIDNENYVLTPDYTMKMLNIHERYECGVPVIINGETGVGKTALVTPVSPLMITGTPTFVALMNIQHLHGVVWGQNIVLIINGCQSFGLETKGP